MKTRNFIYLMSVVLFIITFAASSCKKDKNNEEAVANFKEHTDDENDVESAGDDAMNDANDLMSQGTYKSIEAGPANATVDTTFSGDTTIFTITYNGANANNTRTRTGVIVVKKLTSVHWKDAGAICWVTFVNFNVTKISTGKSITFNGKRNFTNVSGGLVKHLGNGTTTQVIHTITGSMTAQFDNGTQRDWNVSRKRTFTGSPGQLIMTVDGTGSNGGYDYLVTWGSNRSGEAFYTQITSSVVRRQACNWNPVTGVKVHTLPDVSKKATITFGFDANNDPIAAGSAACPENYKIDWEKDGETGTVYKPY